MKKSCDLCHKLIDDGEDIVAVVRTVLHEVPSSVTFAIETPSDCIRMFHQGCAEDMENDPDTTIE